MKRGNLIFNPQAGGSSPEAIPNLLEQIRKAGYSPLYEATETIQDVQERLNRAYDVLFVAGGDGTLREVTRCLLEVSSQHRPPIVLLPLGTANNVANMLLPGMTPERILQNLESNQMRGFDVGHVSYEQGQTFFLEGAGTGIFGNIMASYNPEIGKSVWRALWASLDTLSTFEPEMIHLLVDGQALNSCVLMLEVMNTDALGYRFKLAKDADCSDGLLDILLVHQSDETRLLGYVARVIDQSFDNLSNVEVIKGKQIHLTLPEWQFHADAEVISIPKSQVAIEVEHHALTFLVSDPSMTAPSETGEA